MVDFRKPGHNKSSYYALSGVGGKRWLGGQSRSSSKVA